MIEFERHGKSIQDVNLIPLINVIFLLLIFFMVSGTVEQMDTFEVDIPESESGLEQNAEPTTLFIDVDGKMALNNNFVSKDDLPTIISTVLQDDPNSVITIKADSKLKAQKIIWIMNTLNEAGAKNISLVTQSK